MNYRMSYENVYDAAEKMKALEYLKAEPPKETLITDLGDGIRVETVTCEKGEFNRFLKDGVLFFEHVSSSHHGYRFKEIIRHRNGHRYIAYHPDLYGIGFYDLDTDEHYEYIAEGYLPGGESFIVTDIHYDSEKDLIACGGCYWAGPYGTIVFDLSDPLHFDPVPVYIRDVCMGDNDEDDEYDDDWDFVRWEEDGIVVRTDSEKREHFVSTQEIRRALAKKHEEQ